MAQSNLYINVNSGKVITKEHRYSVIMFTKVLYRLSVISDTQALKLADMFQILFV